MLEPAETLRIDSVGRPRRGDHPRVSFGFKGGPACQNWPRRSTSAHRRRSRGGGLELLAHRRDRGVGGIAVFLAQIDRAQLVALAAENDFARLGLFARHE